MSTEIDSAGLDVRAEEGQYHLQASYVRVNPWPQPSDSLSTGEDNWIAVITGTSMGPVHVDVALHSQRPEPALSGWEMVAERDIIVGTEGLTIRRPLGRSRDPHLALSALPGRYRVRIHASGRDEASRAGPVLTSPLERHLIEIWPVQEPQPPQVLLGPDQYGQHYL